MLALSAVSLASCSTPCALQNQAKVENYLSEFGEVNTPGFFKSWRNCNATISAAESLAEKECREAMLSSYVLADGQRYRLQSPYLEQDRFQTWKPKKLLSYEEQEQKKQLEETEQPPHNHNIEDPIELGIE